MTETEHFCGHCGAPLVAGAQFCGKCGETVAAAAPAEATIPAADQGEKVLGVIVGLQKRRGLFGSDIWSAIVTRERIAFALTTKDMMNDAVRTARDQAKSEGKGFLGQVAAQMGWMQLVVNHYAAMPVPQALAEQPGNFYFLPNQIRKVKVEHRRNSQQHMSSDHVVFETTSGKYEFQLLGGGRDEARSLLASVLGAAVQ